LFGGGGGNKDGEKKGPSMMDQLAMFKKAQEMAQKKQKLDEELKKEVFMGSSADGKVKASFKFVPVSNPLDPNPDYEPTGFEFDDEYYQSASVEELSEAVYASILDGIEKTNMAVAQKYTVLQNDLMEAFGQKPK
jgi:YbaB/EbfC DNA-binding family